MGGGDGWWFVMTVSDNNFLTQDVKLQVIHFSLVFAFWIWERTSGG